MFATWGPHDTPLSSSHSKACLLGEKPDALQLYNVGDVVPSVQI